MTRTPSNHREQPAAYLDWLNLVFSWCPQDPLAEDTANVAKPAEQTIEAGEQLTKGPVSKKRFCPSEDETLIVVVRPACTFVRGRAAQ